MENENSKNFSLAAKFFLKKLKKSGRSQAEFAQELDISSAYLSSIVNGSKIPSFELSSEIAKKLYGSLDRFLYVGRRVKEGKAPLPPDEESQESEDVEHLIARLTHYVLDHKRIETEINDLKKFYESIIENLQSSICVMSDKHKITYTNQRISEVFGVDQKQIIGKSLFDINESIPGLGLYPFVQAYMEAYESKIPQFYSNIQIVKPDGNVSYLSGWAIPLYENSDLHGMICTIRDTTDSHASLHLLVHSLEEMDDGAVIVRQEKAGDIPKAFFANRQFRKIFKLPEMDPFESPFADFLSAMQKNLINKKEYKEFVLETIKDNTENATFMIETVGGKKFFLRGNPITDNRGVHIGRMAILKEI